jgi:hypothetical protein
MVRIRNRLAGASLALPHPGTDRRPVTTQLVPNLPIRVLPISPLMPE